MRRSGLWASYGAAFTLTWNGWYVGPVRPGDVLVLISLLLLTVTVPHSFARGVPWWIAQLAVALLLLTTLLVLRPPDSAYLVTRVRLDAGGVSLPSPTASAASNIGTGAKFLVSTVAIPISFASAVAVDSRALVRLAIAFASGAALSGAVAFIDHLHLASIGQILTGVVNVGNRQAGFTSHPNFLAVGLVLAMPFAAWLTTREGRESARFRLLGWTCLSALVLGTYSSGSRGGAVMAVVTVFIAYALLPRSRIYVPASLLSAAAAVGLVIAFVPSLGTRILATTRLGSGIGAGSSEVRAIVGHQGVVDFAHYPLYGVGLQFGTDASQVYLQELSAGGLLLFASVSIYLLGAAADAVRLMRAEPLAPAVLAALIATAGLDLVETDLTDRFYYIPEAILVACLVRTQARSVPGVAHVLPRGTAGRAA